MSELILELPTVTASADRLLAALRRCHDELAARVRGLGEADLTRQSYCTDWSVAQVLSHLGSGAEIALAQLQAARASTTPLGLDDFRAVWARWDARLPRQQAAAFAEAVPRLHDAVDGLDGAERRELRPYFPAGHVDLPAFLAFRLVEQALHAWDVHVAFEPARAVDADAVGLLVELLPSGASLVDAQVLGGLAPARLAMGRCRGRCGCRPRRWSGCSRAGSIPRTPPRAPVPRVGRPWTSCGGCIPGSDPPAARFESLWQSL